MTFRFAQHKDLPIVKKFLSSARLPYEDIDAHILNFLLAEKNSRLIGAVGIELLGNVALLRSLAVKKTVRNGGIGKKLVDHIKAYAQLNNVEKWFLLTTTAQDFFQKIGFEVILRTEAPPEIHGTEEFKHICPSSAIFMTQDLRKE